MRAGAGGSWYHAPMLLGSGEVKHIYSGFLYIKRKGTFTSIRMHSNSDNKRGRRMRGIKCSAVGECAE